MKRRVKERKREIVVAVWTCGQRYDELITRKYLVAKFFTDDTKKIVAVEKKLSKRREKFQIQTLITINFYKLPFGWRKLLDRKILLWRTKRLVVRQVIKHHSQQRTAKTLKQTKESKQNIRNDTEKTNEKLIWLEKGLNFHLSFSAFLQWTLRDSCS